MGAQDPKAPQCTATSRTSGERCKQRPIPGGTVCYYHGGAAPQVRNKAALRLAQMVDPALKTMAKILVDADSTDHAKLRAVENILDRAGVSRKAEVITVEASREILTEQLLAKRRERLLAELEAAQEDPEEAEQRAEAEAALEESEGPEDAEVLEIDLEAAG